MIDKDFMQVEGMDSLAGILEILSRMPTAYKGIEYRGQSAGAGGGVSATDKLNYLDQSAPDGGRDFRTPNDHDADMVADAFAREVDRQLERYAAQYEKRGPEKMGADDAVVRRITANAWKEAAKKMTQVMQEMVLSSQVADGQAAEVTPEYAKQRAREWGQPEDTSLVGQASRELLDSLNPDLAVGNFDLLT